VVLSHPADHAMAAIDPALPCPLPARADNDAEVLGEYRAALGDERVFTRARRSLRESGDWSSMAKLLIEHAASLGDEPDKQAKVAELAVQAYEVFAERLGDKASAVHALSRAVLAQPENDRAYERLYLAYRELVQKDPNWASDFAALLRWRMGWARKAQPSLLAGLHYAYAELLRTSLHAIGEAVEHYEHALAQDPMLAEASDQLVELHVAAGAWARAVQLMEAELSQLEAHPSYAADPAVAARISDLHLRLAKIASEQHQDLASAARHLQSAIKITPTNLQALRAFGTLYLGSGKASDEGKAKASAIFLKAAQLARSGGDHAQSLKLLRRTLILMPNHFASGELFAELLAEQAHWMELDDHYRHVLTYAQGPQRTSTLLRRAANLDQRLQRREEARVCYEEAGQFQGADGEAWLALERIYRDSADWSALSTLLEWKIEQLGHSVSTASLLEAAKIFHHQLDDHERAALFYFKVLEREPFDAEAFEGYKEHFRQKHAWSALRDLIFYQIDQASDAAHHGLPSPLHAEGFTEEFVELAEICERRLGDVDGAVHAWTRMAQTYPHDARPHEHISRIQKRTRMWDNMVRVQEAELARTQEPRKRLEIIKRLAQIYRDRQVNPQRAIELYSEQAYLAPEDGSAIRALTALYDRAGDHQQVLALLRQQYETAHNETERVSLLRRMAEIWHHEMAAYAEATWACEEILAVTGNDLEALHRLQLLAQESNDFELLVAALEREYKVTGKASGKAQILRRLARVTESRLLDPERAAHYWSRLLDLEPDNLEVVDKMVAVYDAGGRFEELAELLGRAAASNKTPIIRQLDYLVRLGYLAQSTLGDPDLARSAYERVIKIRPDHRQALDALASLYRIDDDAEGLAEILGKMREIADSDEEAFAFAWEQAQLLLGAANDPVEAAEVLAWTAKHLRPGDGQVNAALIDAYRMAGKRPELIAQAELMLLGVYDPTYRGRLHELIIKTWHEADNKRAAMRASERRLHEFPQDPQGHAQLAELQEELGEFEQALRSLARKLELVAHDPDQQIATLRRMAEIADLGLADRNRALELLRRASGIDPTDPELRDHIEQFAEAHGTWKELLEIDELRLNRLAEMGDVGGQLEICSEASRIAEDQIRDPDRAFAWARRGYFLARAQQLDFDQGYRRLGKLAEDYKLWTALLEVTERELERQTFADEYEIVDRLQAAAEIAENELKDPRRAVAYLQRALQENPDDEEVARRIQTIAEAHELWEAQLGLNEHRLAHASSAGDRFDAFCAMSRIHERKLLDPRSAFSTLRRAWKDLSPGSSHEGGGAQFVDKELAAEALDMAVSLAESHRLWRELAEHHAALAHEQAAAGERIAAVDALAEAARIVDERLDDPLSAMRVLLRGITIDRERDVIEPRLRELAARVDKSAEQGAHAGVKLGALVELRAIGELIAAAERDVDKIALLAERAQLRELRLDDGIGALAEWLRVLTLDRTHIHARNEAERLAGHYDLWHRYLLLPAWELEQAHDNRGQALLLGELADLYEHRLGRPEYALRARLEAWRRNPSLPPHSAAIGPIVEPHVDLWRLAGVVGSYAQPALPNDNSLAMLTPDLPAPELADRKLWTRAGLDPQHLTAPGGTDAAASIVQYADPHAKGGHDELTAVAPLDDMGRDESGVVEISRVELVQEVSRVELLEDITEDSGIIEVSRVEVLSAIREGSVVEELDDLEDFEEIEELDELEEVSSAEFESASVSGEIGSFADPRKAHREARKGTIPGALDPKLDPKTERHGSKTIPLPKPDAKPAVPPPGAFDLGRGLPKLPRPKVASAWEEIANAYAELPTANKQQKLDVQLACARLWEEGASVIERAFNCHERALQLIPEHPDTLASLESLAARHDARPRLLRAWEQLLNEAALPEHVIALNLRIADFHEFDDALEPAEARYRAVLAVNSGHLVALRKLLTVYDLLERRADYVETYADLLNAERSTLEDGERIERSLRLSELYEEHGRSDDAIELLRFLARDFPERPDVHARIADLLVRRAEWPQAIDALRTANEALFDPDLRADNLARIAEIYGTRLRLPDRAIEAWNDYRELRPLDDRPLAELQSLYLETTRWNKLLPIIETRLEQLGQDNEIDERERQARRIKLLVVKARALQEGLGDELAATETLEQLSVDAPDDDEVALGLSRLYRRTDRFEAGVSLLSARVDRLRASLEALPVDATDPGLITRIRNLSTTLARVLHEEGKRHAAARDVVERALALAPEDAELLTLLAKLARSLNDLPLLLGALERLGVGRAGQDELADPDALLEAAELARTRLAEPQRAMAAYERVLAESKRGHEADETWAARLTRAIEGLVRLRIETGDIAGATAFMDEQLAGLSGDRIRARLLTEIGRITYRTTGDVAASRARFEAALVANPDHAEARLGLGELLLDTGNIPEAEKLLESAVEALTLVRDQIHLVEGLVLLARLFEVSDRSGEAYRRLTTALRHDPDDLSIRLAVVRNRHGARRFKDVLTAVEQLEQRLEARVDAQGRLLPLSPREAKLVAEMYAIAADCDLAARPGAGQEGETKNLELAENRLRRALEFDPDNHRALATMVPWLRDRGNIVEAASLASRLAAILEHPHARGSAWVDAGMLYYDAAQLISAGQAEAQADTPAQPGHETASARDLTASERRTRVAEFEREAFECVRMGIMLVSDSPTPVLDFSQLEVAFRASALHDRPLALRCLERLLLREMGEDRRVELLLAGVRVALPQRTSAKVATQASDSETSAPAAGPGAGADAGPQPSLELAMRYADAAIERAPLSSAAILAKAEVLEAAGRTEELQPLVSGFLARLEAERANRGEGTSVESDLDLAARVTLLIRLASLQLELAPAEAAASLEDAARLTAKMRRPSLSDFGLVQRKQLAQLYERLEAAGKVTSDHKVASNHRGLLLLDPVYLPSLRALARRSRDAKHFQRARALYSIIALLNPDSASGGPNSASDDGDGTSSEGQDARAFLAAHVETLGPEPQEIDLPAVTGEMPNDGGLPSALAQLWEAGQALLGDVFGRLEFDAKARVSPIAEGVLAQAWREVLRRLGQTKIALVADPTLDGRDDNTSEWFEPRCQLPPILVAGKRAREAGEDQRRLLEFMLARGLFSARAEVVMFSGLEHAKFAAISSAVLLALHPRHAQRKQNTRAANDTVSKLGHELGRKLPIRVARQITTDFTEHEHERFDARALRVWVRRAADRVGLLVCGDVQVAIDALHSNEAAAPEPLRGRLLAERVAADPDLHALLAFVASGAYADRRRQLGWIIEGDEPPSDRASGASASPPISVQLSPADVRVPAPVRVIPEPAAKPAPKPIVVSAPVSRPTPAAPPPSKPAPLPIARPAAAAAALLAPVPAPAPAPAAEPVAELDDDLDDLALDDIAELVESTVPGLPPPEPPAPVRLTESSPQAEAELDDLDELVLDADEALDAVDLDDVELD
jgi:tetratricopeptide (TPR) repeat protein